MAKNIDYKKRVTRQITFPKRLMDSVEIRARQYGYSFPEYVRYVLTKDLEEQMINKENIFFEKDFVEGIVESIKECEDGKAVTLKNKKEIREYFTSLMNE